MSTAATARPRFRRPTFLVYNPMDTGKDYQVLDKSYHWPPMDTVEVGDAYTWPKDDDGRLLTSGRKEIIADARSVAELICDTECLGPLGFVILEGTVKEQSQLMRAAREDWVKVRSLEIDTIISGWEHHVAAVRLPGSPPPRQPKRVQRAYADREKFSFDGEERKAFVCDFCGADFDESDQMRQHNIVHHPAAVVPNDKPRPVETKAQPDIKKGKALLATAKDSRVELSVADRKGLQFGDPDVIADVEGRIDAKEAVTDDKDEASGVDMSPDPGTTPGPTGPKSRKAAEAKSKETVQ